ncbi:hypothetical protein GCM10009682_03650 [Luedemannella flava]|uniref:NarG-like domain-containing protein n=1 Tax=Luedemannella flava TaxID=349316 RepID=A0ABP4XMA9_9ACTN
MLHLGVITVFVGHVLGLLVPRRWTAALGISDRFYHLISVTAGTLAGVVIVAGLALLVARRVHLSALRRSSTATDVVMYALLAVVVLLGLWAKAGVNMLGQGHDYRETVAVWFRGVLVLRPDASLMTGVPVLMQLHTLAALALMAIWPITRLVHAWAVTIGVLWRPRPVRVDRPHAG